CRRRVRGLVVCPWRPRRVEGEQQSAVGGHAVRAAIIDRLADLAVRAAEPPPAVRQTRPHPTGAGAAVTTVAIHRGEDLRPLIRRPFVSPVGILPAHGLGDRAACEHVLVVTHGGEPSLLVGGRALPAPGHRSQEEDRKEPHPFTAANPPMTAITTPSPIFAAAPAARPSTAPQPARTATVGVRDHENSNNAAPANAPRKAPITLPTIGTGPPTT